MRRRNGAGRRETALSPLRVARASRPPVELHVDPDEWARAHRVASRRGTWIEVENEVGDVLAIDPEEVTGWTFEDDALARVIALPPR